MTNRLMPISGVKRERDEQIGLIYTTTKEFIDLKDCLNDAATKRLIQRKSETTKNKLLLQIILPANEKKKESELKLVGQIRSNYKRKERKARNQGTKRKKQNKPKQLLLLKMTVSVEKKDALKKLRKVNS